MLSTRDPTQTDRADVLVERGDDDLARAHEQMIQILRANEQLSEVEHDTARHPSDLQVGVNVVHWLLRARSALRGVIGLLTEQIMQILRANERFSEPAHAAARHPSDPRVRMNTRRWSLRSRPALCGVVGVLLAAGICAAFAWQRSTPQLASASSLPLDNMAPSARPSPPAIRATAVDAELPQPAPLAQIRPQDVTPTTAPMSPELVQLLQTMSRDLANLQQGIEQLKTSQEQIARENAKATEQLKASQEQMARANAESAKQLKASQEQMARVIAKLPEQNLRPKPSSLAPRPTATPMSKPVAALRKPATARQSPRSTEQAPARAHLNPEEE